MIMESRTLFLDVFRTVVARCGDLSAIEFAGKPYATYKELDLKARLLAGALIDRGAKPETFVGIGIEKSPEYIVCLLAVWYAGAAFVPLDPKLPDARLRQITEDCQLQLIIDQALLDKALSTVDSSALSQPTAIAPDTLAYAIFTSGSTGRPKGVLVTHSGITSLLEAQIRAFRLTEGSRSLFMLSTNFDASVSDIGCALLSGATLCMERQADLEAGPKFVQLIGERRISHIDIPPSLMRLLPCKEMPECLKTLIIGGEVCPPPVVREWASRFLVVNVYGPTEATVCTSMGACDAKSWDRPLIGNPLPNVLYRIVDEELYIGGPCLARGYLNRPELTETKFVELDKQRWYRTGDRVVQHASGDFEFCGRIDRQVKVRGVLVEPEEIEARLAEHAAIRRVVVLKRHYGADNGREGLVAFIQTSEPESADILHPGSAGVTPAFTSTTPSVKELRSFVAETLPRWMIPHRWQFLAKLPQTLTGKVDMDVLRSCDLLPHASSVAEPDLPEAISLLIRTVQDVLGVDGVSADDDFFELGGDSFSVIELAMATEARGLNLSPSLIMSRPTIRALIDASLALADNAELSSTASGAMSAESLRKDIDSNTGWKTLLGEAVNLSGAVSNHPETVLLTGASGYLGSRLLHEILTSTDAKVTCLVRCTDAKNGLARVQQALSTHNLTLPSDLQNRVAVIPSDLELFHFGLDETNWRCLADQVDTIYHCAAQVNVLLPYADLRGPNVEGTMEIVRLMADGRRKCLHYASTLSVFVATDRNLGRVFESDDLSQTNVVYGGYAQTKWVSEVLLRSIDNRLGPVSYYRFGLIVADCQNGKAPKNDFLAMFTKGIDALGCVPELKEDISVDITPVDFAASAMMELSLRDMAEATPFTYHIANPDSLRLSDLITALRTTGSNIDSVTPDEFQARIKVAAESNSLSTAESAACLALCRGLTGFDTFDRLRTMDLFQATGITFDTANTFARTNRRPPDPKTWAALRLLAE